MKNNNIIPVFFGNKKIMDYNISILCRFQEKFFICPNCMSSINLGRHKESEPFGYEKEFTFWGSLDIKSEKEYLNHVKNCSSTLKIGINKIDENSTIKSFKIVEQLSKWCKKETGYDGLQVSSSDFKGGLNSVIAYIYKTEDGPVSFIAYRNKSILDEKKEEIEIMFIWDLFTFQKFRKKGYATKLLHYSSKDLVINRNLLPVSGPVTKHSYELIKNFSTDKILIYSQKGLYKLDKKDLSKFLSPF